MRTIHLLMRRHACKDVDMRWSILKIAEGFFCFFFCFIAIEPVGVRDRQSVQSSHMFSIRASGGSAVGTYLPASVSSFVTSAQPWAALSEEPRIQNHSPGDFHCRRVTCKKLQREKPRHLKSASSLQKLPSYQMSSGDSRMQWSDLFPLLDFCLFPPLNHTVSFICDLDQLPVMLLNVTGGKKPPAVRWLLHYLSRCSWTTGLAWLIWKYWYTVVSWSCIDS